jgi:hypothetical protein
LPDFVARTTASLMNDDRLVGLKHQRPCQKRLRLEQWSQTEPRMTTDTTIPNDTTIPTPPRPAARLLAIAARGA